MSKSKFDFDKYLAEKMKNPEYAKMFRRQQRKLRKNIQKAREREKQNKKIEGEKMTCLDNLEQKAFPKNHLVNEIDLRKFAYAERDFRGEYSQIQSHLRKCSHCRQSLKIIKATDSELQRKKPSKVLIQKAN